MLDASRYRVVKRLPLPLYPASPRPHHVLQQSPPRYQSTAYSPRPYHLGEFVFDRRHLSLSIVPIIELRVQIRVVIRQRMGSIFVSIPGYEHDRPRPGEFHPRIEFGPALPGLSMFLPGETSKSTPYAR
jgi:hypothetical protein